MNFEDKITIFAKTNFRNKDVAFGIKPDDRRRHMYLIGKTGMGKTTLMENMAIQDIRNGHGTAFLDPHGDSIQRILNCIPPARINDVIYFNPADLDNPLAFNILEAVENKFKHLVASGLMGVFTKIWANVWSARMEYILNNTILALLDSPGNTLLGITRMYIDKKYRKKIIDNIKDPVVKAFWTDEYANYNEKYRTEAIAPIQNKVGQFLSSGIVRNIVGQPKSTIDLREIMDSQKILIMDLSKGKVGEDNSALLGAMIVTKLQLAAMSRTDISESERKDFYLYVDEFQNFATDSFATILSEARKYRLNLIVGHQYIGQLIQEKNTKVRDAIFGNVGTLVVFRVGAEDAEFLVKEFDPIFTEVDLVNLPKYHIILKLMINGVASEPFSAVTIPPSPEYFVNTGEKVMKVSRERYTNPVIQVEEKISRWMGAEYHQSSALSIGTENATDEAMEDNISVFEPETKKVNAVLTSKNHREPEMSLIMAEKKKFSAAKPEEGFNKKTPLTTITNYPSQKSHPADKNKFSLNSKTLPRNKHSEEKKENPIWSTVMGIHSQKQKEQKVKTEKALKTIQNFVPKVFGSANETSPENPTNFKTPLKQLKDVQPDNLLTSLSNNPEPEYNQNNKHADLTSIPTPPKKIVLKPGEIYKP